MLNTKTAPYKQQYKHANFISLVDNSILLGKWTKPSFTENKALFTIGKESYTYEDFRNIC